MTDEAALLRAICEQPDEDTPRLLYADWHMEYGDAVLGEYIRICVETDGQPGCPKTGAKYVLCRIATGCERCDKLHRLNAIYDDVWKAQDAELARFGCVRPNDPHRGRGLVYRIHLPQAAFLEHAAEIFARWPITEVRLTDKRATAAPGGFVWGRGGGDESWRLAGPLYDRLDGFWTAFPGGNLHSATSYYHDQNLATAAQSRACVAFGRHAAGLTARTPSVTA